jgi:DNA-binding transcriptional ArsR family regulator
VDAALQAIAEPRRRAILQLVSSQELPAGAIASHFAITRPAISQHLRVLEDAGLVTVRREGTRRLYRARPEGLDELRAFFEQLWDDSLARLKDAIEATPRSTEDAEKEPDAHNRDRHSD